MNNLRQASDEESIVRGLLARASIHHFALSLTPQADSLINALRNLEETHDIAQRNGMLLFLTDYHLEACRLALTINVPVHDLSAAQHFAEAKTRVEELGYGRRKPEVAYLAGLIDG